MNTKNSFRSRSAFSLIEVMIVVAIIAIIAVLCLPRRVRAQGAGQVFQPNVFTFLTNWTAVTISSTSTSTQTSGETNGQAPTIRGTSGEGFLVSVTTTNSGDTAGGLLNFDVTCDGTATNWTTNNTPFTAVIKSSGVGTVVTLVQFTGLQIGNFRQIFPTSMVNSNSHNMVVNWIEAVHNNQ